MLVAWLVWLASAQNAPFDTPINCTRYVEFNYAQSWNAIRLKQEDILII
jgi:hypothetical protein